MEALTDSDAMTAAFRDFRQKDATFDSTALLDDLRLWEYGRLDDGGHIYLDYTGGGLYAESQLRAHMGLLRRNVFGNPHSVNPTSSAATSLVERARDCVLEYFNASPDEYVAIFTPNATGALRLVGEAYPFRAGDRFLLTFDNHNSVNGIREFARARAAETSYVPSVAPHARRHPARLRRRRRRPPARRGRFGQAPARDRPPRDRSGGGGRLAALDAALRSVAAADARDPRARPRAGHLSCGRGRDPAGR